jgi:hypothetical protein
MKENGIQRDAEDQLECKVLVLVGPFGAMEGERKLEQRCDRKFRLALEDEDDGTWMA